MLSWWKKKLGNGFGSTSPSENHLLIKRRQSTVSTVSNTTSTLHTDKELLSTYEFELNDKDKKQARNKSINQCCKTFVNWYIDTKNINTKNDIY